MKHKEQFNTIITKKKVKLYVLRLGGDCIYQQSIKIMHYEPDFFFYSNTLWVNKDSLS